jgi:hypothetical protein
MPFDSDVIVREVGDDTWELVEPIRYRGNRDMFVVPKGFSTDFASVPRAFQWLLPRYGAYTKSAILHDFLCDESKAGRFDRDDADGLFRRSMRELGVSFLRRWLMWAAVSAATRWIDVKRGRFRRIWTWRFAQLSFVALPSIVFFLTPAIVVTAWLGMFWVADVVVFVGLKPFSKKQVNPPRFTWGLSHDAE